MRNLCLLWLVAAGCSVDIEVASLSIIAPAPGSTHTRDTLASSGALVAPIGVEVDTGGDIARVAISAGDVVLGDLDGGAFAAEVAQRGPVTLTAIAYNDDGVELLRGSVDVTIEDPAVADCTGWLDLYQLSYTSGPANPGIATPVTVMLPLSGIAYRVSGAAAQRKTLYGDCTLMKSLAEAAPMARAHDVVEIVDMGIYNYRCIDQTKTPPNCTMSQHAYAKAIDIAELVTGDGTRYSVLNDWVIDPADDTCTAATEGDKDSFLHDVICELKAAGVWNIVLTPNYNAAHRNHFHVDLTAGSDFIERRIDELASDAIDLHETTALRFE